MSDSQHPERQEAQELKELVGSEGHFLVFQPICSPKGKILKYEALVRFPGRNTEETIVALENAPELIAELTRQIIQKTLAFLAESKRATGLKVPPIAVNLPPELIGSWEALPDEIRTQLHRHGLSGENLQMEVTERGILDLQREKLRHFCDRLSALGVIVMQDDFDDSSAKANTSAEQTAFDVIEKTGLKGLKVNARFLIANPDAAEVIAYAKTHDLCLVVEQVRDADIKAKVLNKLAEAKFPTEKIGLQGYVFSKPLTPEELVIDLRRRHMSRSFNQITAEAA